MTQSIQLTKQRKQALLVIKSKSSDFQAMSDEELILACQRRLDGAFAVLIKRHEKLIAGMLYRIAPEIKDTSDIMQEVYIRIWTHIWQLRKPSSFKTWLNRIVTNLFFDHLREMPRDFRFVSIDEPVKGDDEESFGRDIPDAGARPEEALLRGELSEALEAAIEHIPERFRTAVILRDLEGLSYEQIATLTSVELGTVKSRVSRARTKIQKRLAPYLDACA